MEKRIKFDCTKSIIVFNTGLLFSLYLTLFILYIVYFNIPLNNKNDTDSNNMFFNVSKLKIIKDLLKYHINREKMINDSWLEN